MKMNIVDILIAKNLSGGGSGGGGGSTPVDHVTFTSADVQDVNATAWTSVSILGSGETLSSLFQKVSEMFKNIRFLHNEIEQCAKEPREVSMTGSAVTINGEDNTHYSCGEVATISTTPPASGSIEVTFTSGATPAVLTVASGVKMPEWFVVEANRIYEISFKDRLGAVMSWQV